MSVASTWRQVIAMIIIVWCLLILTFAGLGIFDMQIADKVTYLAGATLIGRGLNISLDMKKPPPQAVLPKNKICFNLSSYQLLPKL